MPEPFTAAVVQMASIPDDPTATAERAAARLREAAGRDARLVVFPEALIGGYPKGASFGAPIGMRKPERRDAFARYHAAAIELDGPEVALLTQACADVGAFAVVGVIERDGGTLYCTALYLDGAKGLVGKHGKLMPTAAERLVWGFGARRSCTRASTRPRSRAASTTSTRRATTRAPTCSSSSSTRGRSPRCGSGRDPRVRPPASTPVTPAAQAARPRSRNMASGPGMLPRNAR